MRGELELASPQSFFHHFGVGSLGDFVEPFFEFTRIIRDKRIEGVASREDYLGAPCASRPLVVVDLRADFRPKRILVKVAESIRVVPRAFDDRPFVARSIYFVYSAALSRELPAGFGHEISHRLAEIRVWSRHQPMKMVAH
jgi:hypothetical protein